MEEIVIEIFNGKGERNSFLAMKLHFRCVTVPKVMNTLYEACKVSQQHDAIFFRSISPDPEFKRKNLTRNCIEKNSVTKRKRVRLSYVKSSRLTSRTQFTKCDKIIQFALFMDANSSNVLRRC